MRVHITRDSVHSADDATAPNTRSCRLDESWSCADLARVAFRAADLPSNVAGGNATWVLASGIPIAVAAQQWDAPRVLPEVEARRAELDVGNGVLRVHWSYLGQIDPEVVLQVLQRLRLRIAEERS